MAFTPIGLKEQSDEQKEKVEFITEQWEDHLFVKNYHGQWEEFIAFFEGNQYAFYNPETEQLEDVVPFPERETKNVYNRIMPAIRAQWGELMYSHDCYIIPQTTESEDIKGAKAASMFIEFTDELRKFNSKIIRAKLYAILLGVCYWKEWWDESLFGYAETSGKKLQKIPGDVNFDFVNPFNCRPDPCAMNREGWNWFIEGQRVNKAGLEEQFKLEPDTLETAPESNRDVHLYERDGFVRSDIPEAMRIEYWQRPTREHPQGRFMVTSGEWILHDGENKNPEYDLPYFKLPGVIPKLGEPVDISAVATMKAAQKQLNKYASMVDEHIANFRLKGMIPRGSLQGGELKSWQRAGVDFVEYEARHGLPSYQSPPPIPPAIIERLNWMENEIETESSVRKTSLGQLPKYAQRASGVLFDSIKSQDRMVLLPQLNELDDTVKDSKRFRLQLIQKHYTVKRMIKTVGRDKEPIISNLKGAEVGGNTDVRVKAGIDIMTNRDKKQEVVMKFIEKGLIEDPRKALELLDYKGLDEYMEEEFIDERQAHRHIDFFRNGKPYIAANPEDNHEVHYKVFNNFRKTDDFTHLSKEIQGMIKKRIKKHREYIEAGKREPEEIIEEKPMPAPAPVPGAQMALPGVAPPMPVGMPPPMPAGEGLTPEKEAAMVEVLKQAIIEKGGG